MRAQAFWSTIYFLRFSPQICEFTNEISPVCLPDPGDEDPVGSYCYATGKNFLFMPYWCN